MARFRRKRFLMNDLEIDQARPAGLLVINQIVRACVAVRPWAVKLLAP